MIILRHGILESIIEVRGAESGDVSVYIIKMVTDASDNTFDPLLTVSSGTLNWNLGDASSSVDANSFSHTYSETGNKTVYVYPGTTDGSGAVTQVALNSDDLVGTLDISALTNLGGAFLAYTNSKLTSILNPISSEKFTEYNVRACDLTGTLDISGLTGLGGELWLFDNDNLTSVLLPNSSDAFSQFYLNDCDLTGTIDCTGLTGLSGAVRFYGNGNLTSILFPTSSGVITEFKFQQCDITGTLDISGLTGLGGEVKGYQNSNLTNILFPPSSEEITELSFSNCDLTGTLNLLGLTIGTEIKIYSNSNLTNIIFPDSDIEITDLWLDGNNFTGTIDISGLTNLSGTIKFENNDYLQDILLPATFGGAITSFDADDCSLSQTTVHDILSKINTYFTASLPTDDIAIDLVGGENSWPKDGSANSDKTNIESVFASEGYTATIDVEDDPTDFVIRMHTEASTNAFDPTVDIDSVHGGTLEWDMGDGSIINSNNFSHTYTEPGEKTVYVKLGTVGSVTHIKRIDVREDDLVGVLDMGLCSSLGNEPGSDFVAYGNSKLTTILNPTSTEEVTYYDARSCNLTGTLDLRGFSNFGGTFQARSNANLTQILHSPSPTAFSYYYAYNCDLIGTLDLSGLTGLGGFFSIHDNPNLTNILFPTSSVEFDTFYPYACDLTGTLDISGLTGLGNNVQIQDNPSLTKIINPTSSVEFNYYYAYDCDLTGTFDCSGLTGLANVLRLYNNPNLTEILWPTFGYPFTEIRLDDCSLGQTSVDDLFSKLNTYYTANAPTAGLTVDLTGGGNSWPTLGYDNSDISSLIDIFDTASQDVSIKINPYPILLTDLVAYYNFDETEGTTLNDSLGTYDLSIYNDPSMGEDGVVGTSYMWDSGKNTYAKEDVSTGDFYFTDYFTIAAWIKTNDETGDFDGIAGVYSGTAGGWAFFTGPSYFNYSMCMQIAHSGGSVTGVGDTNIFDNVWHHVAAVWDGSHIIVYIDGVPDASPPSFSETPVYDGYFTVGARSYIGNRFYGNIDEMGIWHKALTATDISTLFNNGTGKTYPFI